MVTFANLNLTEAMYPSLANNTQAMDIIFCRNVLMYFTDEVAAKISQNLFHSLNPDGWFIVSSCELSAHVFPQFNPVNFPGAILYRKRQTDFSEPLPNQSAGPGLLVPDITADTVASRFTGNDPDDLPVDFSDNEIAGFATTTPAGGVAMDIRLLANQGHHLEALILCNEGITNDKLAIGLYFLRASILQESGNFIEAISSVKQAVYLDPDFAMGHFMLGNIYQQQGKTRHAKRHFNNVLELLINTNGDDILPESDGLTVNYIREVILAHMQKHPII
jgi:chemotaxis protein methyltransferase CheR